jgi:hypothetical protein
MIHERNHDEIRTYLTHILTEFTPFNLNGGRGIYGSQPVSDALEIVSRSNTPPLRNREPRIVASRKPPQLPPISRSSIGHYFDQAAPPGQTATPPASESQISLPIDNTPSIWNSANGTRSGNLTGLVDYLIDHKTGMLSVFALCQ